MDWIAHWQSLVDSRRRTVEGLGEANRATGDYWDRRADQFRRMTEQHDMRDDLLVQMLSAALGPEGTLLDVGAGAGRYAIPLAQRGHSVTAVEPSAGMRQHLAERAAEAGLANLQVVPATWEQAEVAPHDVVLASHILYPIAAVVPFVQKLVAHARRAWFITIRVEPMGGELGPIWEAIHHVPYPAEPVFLDLYNLLFAIGLRPDVRLRPFMGGPWRASSLAEAVTGTRARLFLADDDHRYDDQIEAFLRTAMREQDGAWHWPQQRLEAIVSGVTTPLNVPPSGGTEPLEGPR